MPKNIIKGTLATAAVTVALAGCSSSSNAGPAAAGGSATPTGSSTAGAPGSGTGAGAPGEGSPVSGSPSTAPGAGSGTGAGTGTGDGTGTGAGAGKGAGTGTGTGSGDAPGGYGAGDSPRCTSQTLSASLTSSYAVETNRYVTLVLTNTSETSCTVRGWSGLQLVNAAGLVHTNVIRHGTPRTVALPSGGRAYERLYWTSELATDETVPCQPTANALKVAPPNQTRQLEAPWSYGPVCQHGRISITPLSASPTGG